MVLGSKVLFWNYEILEVQFWNYVQQISTSLLFAISNRKAKHDLTPPVARWDSAKMQVSITGKLKATNRTESSDKGTLNKKKK